MRFEYLYTPKHRDWLKIAEDELSAMTRRSLHASQIGNVRQVVRQCAPDEVSPARGLCAAVARTRVNHPSGTFLYGDAPDNQHGSHQVRFVIEPATCVTF